MTAILDNSHLRNVSITGAATGTGAAGAGAASAAAAVTAGSDTPPVPPTSVQSLSQIAQRAVDGKQVVRCYFPSAGVRAHATSEGTNAAASQAAQSLRTVAADQPGGQAGTQAGATSTRADAPAEPIVAVINTADVDRYRTIVDPTGGDFGEYLQNPILLWQHGFDGQIGSWPVGNTLSITPGQEVLAAVRFDTVSPLGSELDRLYRSNILRGFSIGFIPSDYTVEMVDGKEVLRYTKWKLVELSCVAVPANPRALAKMIKAGEVRSSELAATLTRVCDLIETRVNEEVQRRLAGKTANGAAPNGAAPAAAIERRDSMEVTVCFDDLELPEELLSTLASAGANADAAEDADEGGESTEAGKPLETVAAKGASATGSQPGATVAIDTERAWKHRAECSAASPAALRSMAALMLPGANGQQDRAMFVHHHADGDLSLRALLVGMTRLLTQPVEDLTADQKRAVYDHLAAHYREAGIEPPAAGSYSPEESLQLALEGRGVHFDEAGYAWMFVEPVERDGRHYPGFTRADDPSAKMLFEPPTEGPWADYRAWGGKQSLVRVGAKFSAKNREALTAHADQLEESARAMYAHCKSLREAAKNIRDMLGEPPSKKQDDEDGEGDDEGDRGVGGQARPAVSGQRDATSADASSISTGFRRTLANQAQREGLSALSS